MNVLSSGSVLKPGDSHHLAERPLPAGAAVRRQPGAHGPDRAGMGLRHPRQERRDRRDADRRQLRALRRGPQRRVDRGHHRPGRAAGAAGRPQPGHPRRGRHHAAVDAELLRHRGRAGRGGAGHRGRAGAAGSRSPGGTGPGGHPAPQTYTVQRGDTLSAIAKRFYGHAGEYRRIAAANNIANPDLIHPGQQLVIPA